MDVRWGDDLDLLGRDTYDEEEILFQDVAHRMMELRGSNLAFPDEGVGLESYLSKPIGSDAVAKIMEADLVTDARIATVRAKAEENGAINVVINERYTLTANPDGSVTWDIPTEGGDS
ncbi:MAG: hypothetical protein KF764_02950 [Labilithrix sp.]|nr:hypothetical protein [Labilithrix sp.]